MMNVIFTIILSLMIGENVAINKAQNDTHDRIFKGIRAREGQFPYMVLIISGLYNPITRYVSACSGSLIKFDTILTAAHCFNGKTPAMVVIMVGQSDASDYLLHRLMYPFSVKYPSRTIQESIASRIHVHPNSYRGYDLAIVKIATPFVRTQYVNTIPFTIGEYPRGTPSNLSGYGENEDGEYAKLAYFTTTEVENDIRQCFLEEAHPYFYCILRLNPIAPKTCEGDSGSPLVNNYKVYGVHVAYYFRYGFGTLCGTPGAIKLVKLSASERGNRFLLLHSQDIPSKSYQCLPQRYVFVTVLLLFWL